MSLNKITYYIAILLILSLFYVSTWFPYNSLIYFAAPFIIITVGFTFFLVYFDFGKYLNLKVDLFTKGNKYLIIILVLILFSILSYNLQEIEHTKNLARLIGYFSIFYIFFLFFPKFLIHNKAYFKQFIKFLANLGFVAALFGIVLFYSGINPMPNYSSQLVTFIRHPNNASIIFTMSAITTMYYYFWQRESLSTFSKSFYITSILLQVYAQLITLTRAGMMGMFFGFFLFFILLYKHKAVYVMPFVILIMPVLVTGFVKAKGFASFLSRFYLLIPAYFMIIDNKINLLWGYGVTNAFKVYQKTRIIYGVYEEAEDPHNSIVSLILMVGVPVTIFIVLFITSLIIYAIRKAIKTKNREEELFFIFLPCFLVSVIIHCLFDSELIVLEYFTMPFFLVFSGFLFYCFKRKIFPLTEVCK